MLTSRLCTQKDKHAIQELWRALFDDSEQFINWFFENRYYPDYSVCIYDNDILVNAMQSMPLLLKVRDTVIQSTLISGVSTKPEYRRRGLMNQSFQYYMQHMKSIGISAVTLKADYIPTYYKAGFYPYTDSSHITISPHTDLNINLKSISNKKVININLNDILNNNIVYTNIDNINFFLQCYMEFSKHYSGIYIRDEQSFKLKMNDYLSDEARCIAILQNESITSYCIYFIQDTKKEIFVEEFISQNAFDAVDLLNELAKTYVDYVVTVKMSKLLSDGIIKKLSKQHYSLDTKAQNSIAITDVALFLKQCCNISDWNVQIVDSFLPYNEGIYDFSGKRTDKAHIKLKSHQLASLVVGYAKLEDLMSIEEAYDKKAYKEISSYFKKLNCFTVDEY